MGLCHRLLPLDLMGGLGYSTIIKLDAPTQRRRGSDLVY